MKRWCGGNDHKTSPTHFFGTQERNYVDFYHVSRMVQRLARWNIFLEVVK